MSNSMKNTHFNSSASKKRMTPDDSNRNDDIIAKKVSTFEDPETLSRMFTGELGPDRDFFIYSRHFNPTVLALDRRMAALEGTETEMGMIIIDGPTVRAFVNDEVEFRSSVDKQFVSLDTNNDGVLSRSEMRKAFETTRFLETDFGVDKATPPEEVTLLYDSIFRSFDEDNNGTVDMDEFRSEVKKIMLAIADGLGSSPIQMAVEDDHSLFKIAADLEAAKTS